MKKMLTIWIDETKTLNTKGTYIDELESTDITIKQDVESFSIVIPRGKEVEFADGILKALFGTTYTELTKEVDVLADVIDSKNDTIEVLADAVEESTTENNKQLDEILELEQKLSDLKCDLSLINGEQ